MERLQPEVAGLTGPRGLEGAAAVPIAIREAIGLRTPAEAAEVSSAGVSVERPAAMTLPKLKQRDAERLHNRRKSQTLGIGWGR
jgi:hypothetical protein